MDKSNDDTKSEGSPVMQIRNTRIRERTSVFAGEHGLTFFAGVLAIISTIIGGGIVGLPYSFLYFGIPLALVLNVVAIILTVLNGMLYLELREVMPDKPNNLYEIGFMLLGRKSIFMISSIYLINAFGLMLIYFITFGQTTASIMFNLIEDSDNFLCEKTCWVLVLGAVLIPVVLMKDLAELKFLSITLFVAIFLFILLNLGQLLFDPNFVKPAEENMEGIYSPIPNGAELISSLSITMVAYSYLQNIFPIYDELQKQTPENYHKIAATALSLTGGLYIAVGLVSLYMFGNCLQSSVLINIGVENPSNWESFVVRIAFMIVLGCHIPFIFYMGKESLLIIIDEINRKSISSALVLKLQGNKTYAKKADAITEPPNPNLPLPTPTNKDMRMTFNDLVQDEIRKSEANANNSNTGTGGEEEDANVNARLRTEAMMSEVTTAKAQKLAYKTMNPILYASATLILYGIIIIGAIFLNDITNIFDIVSAFALTCIRFLFPACFYLLAKK